MGRALMFGENLVEYPRRPTIPDLDEIFMGITHPCDDRVLMEGIKQSSAWCARCSPMPLPDDILIEATGELRVVSVRGIERGCSVYYGVEERLPRVNTVYRVRGAERIIVSDGGFAYDVIYVESPDCFCSWCVRTDGVVLNAESLQVRGECGFVRSKTPIRV